MNSLVGSSVTSTEVLPEIADHVLVRRIGKGAYGEVWLARNVMGGYHAVKVVYRRTFMDERPYLREFEGICKFEPISRNHPGLVTILHVGQDLAAGHFYYVMELADDARTGQEIDTETYVPRTLAQVMKAEQRLPLEKRLQIGLSLASALAYLHAQKLIHRDIKPSNIIFVHGEPKLADIGLITEEGQGVSSVGSLNYMPPEGPGEATGDVFSLGKVFYELFLGMPCKRFPELPGKAEEFTIIPALVQLNNLILKACHYDPRQRFQTANELHEALLAVSETVQEKGGAGSSHSVKRAIEADPNKVILDGDASPGKATGTPGGQPSAKQQPKAGLSRRAALLIGVPTALGGGFFLGRYPIEEQINDNPIKKQQKWQVLYDLLDDKLACFMAYVGNRSPKVKFLIYSRGTDKNWPLLGFQTKWVGEVEARYPELKGRISTMTITIPPGRTRATFKNPETAEEMIINITSMLGLPKGGLKGTSPESRSAAGSKSSPVLVLMDTTAERGVYDEESKDLGITNAEVLQKQLQDLPLRIHAVPISIESSKRDWRGEKRVLDYDPDLVIFHRSAFFHPVNEVLGLGYPPF